ncbi:MAG TPA: SDR family oxidoreductase [Coriobacteriia bacterium]|nr:SDR family oxidoreductase [Coriobacteriia bacterium]
MTDASYDGLFSCAGKTAVVTGGLGLLGREICAGLRAAGADVWAADIAESPDDARYLQIDITSEESVAAALDRVIETSGSLDILVNSAYPRTSDWGAPLATESFGSWTENLDMHLGGYFLTSREAAERMAKAGSGSVINIASIYGIVGPSYEVYDGTSMTMPSAYAAIKGGIINLTRLFATYYGPAGVRCNCLSPGGVEDAQAESFVKRYSELTPLRRMGRPQDMVGGTVFLASDAASFVTGHNLVIDGGWTAR